MVDVLRISDRVARIELPLPLAGLPSVNCYVVLGDDQTLLVDPGWSSPENEAALLDGLSAVGVEPDSIAGILATHHHWDHYTQAITWQRTRGIPVHLGRHDSGSIRAWRSLDGAFPRQVGLLERAGAPDLAVDVGGMDFEPHEKAMDFDLPAQWLDDGDVIDCGGVTVRAIATPGHTRGHLCFEVPGENLLLTGDHVLPRITPSIAYEREPDEHSLTTYLSSLRLVTELPAHRMLPAHGAVEGVAAVRASELIGHHAERLTLIRDLVASGRSTAHEVATAMKWTRRERSLDELEPVHRMTAVLEAAAHLVLLESTGDLTVTSAEGVDRYAVA